MLGQRGVAGIHAITPAQTNGCDGFKNHPETLMFCNGCHAFFGIVPLTSSVGLIIDFAIIVL